MCDPSDIDKCNEIIELLKDIFSDSEMRTDFFKHVDKTTEPNKAQILKENFDKFLNHKKCDLI